MNSALIFPSNLEKMNSNYIILSGREWGTESRDFKAVRYQTKNNVISIALPMPTNGITDSTTHNWESTEGALLNLNVQDTKKRLIKAGLERTKAIFGNLAAAQQFKSGRTINDYAAMTYGGHGFREFDFDFDLIPNNSLDAKIIIDIIESLKFGSLPEYNDATIKYPYLWSVRAINPEGADYFYIKKCAISSLSINKFQENSSIHMDGEPIKTNISINFTSFEKEWANDHMN